MSNQEISAEELDRLFNEGEEDITQYLDLESSFHPGKSDSFPNHHFEEFGVTRAGKSNTSLAILEELVTNFDYSDCACESPSYSLMCDCPSNGNLQSKEDDESC